MMLFPLPENVSFRQGAFAEPVASCINSVKRAQIQMGDTALVTGAGTMGAIFVQLLIRAGISLLIVSEPDPGKRDLAKQLGADVVLDPKEVDVSSTVRELTDDYGVDHAIEASGIRQGLEACIPSVRRGGTVTLHGIVSSEEELLIRPYDFFANVLRLQGAIGLQWASSLKMIPKLELEAMIGGVFKLSDIHAAIDHHRNGDGVKVLLEP
jgi:L-iditol 2-dehydrogenase